MQLTIARSFALGACSVLVVAAAFTAGIGVGVNADRFERAIDESAVRAADPTTFPTCAGPGLEVGSSASEEQVRACERTTDVRNLMLASGATDATVSIDDGPEPSAFIQVQLAAAVHEAWDPERAAVAVARRLGTPRSNVTIIQSM